MGTTHSYRNLKHCETLTSSIMMTCIWRACN